MKITDQEIRTALEHLEVPYIPTHWAQMSENLDDLTAADSRFDASLREKLTHLSSVPQPLNWSDMAGKLDDLDAQDTALERVLQQKLEKIADNQPNHWSMMNERLDREFTLKGKIVRYKVIELAVMLLAIFTIVNNIDLIYDTSPTPETVKNSEQKENTDFKKSYISPFTSSNKKAEINTPKSFKNPLNSGKQEGIKLKKAPNSNINLNNINSQDVLPTGKPIANIDDVKPSDRILSDNKNSLNIAVSPLEMRENGGITEGGVFANVKSNISDNALIDNISISNIDVKTQALPSTINDTSAIASIEVLQANALIIKDLETVPNIPKPDILQKSRWRLSTFATVAFDWVTTSFAYNRQLEKRYQVVPNVNTGITVGYKEGKLELETGLSYKQKNYDLPNVEVTSGNSILRGFSTVTPQNLRLSILSVPLNVNYDVKQSRKWTVYTHAGASLNGIMRAFERVDIKNINPVAKNNAPNVELANYSKGLLAGGVLKENVFVTLGMGVGIEYHLTPKTSLYMQPSADIMLRKQGIGTLNDRLKSFNIQGGAKWKL